MVVKLRLNVEFWFVVDDLAGGVWCIVCVAAVAV